MSEKNHCYTFRIRTRTGYEINEVRAAQVKLVQKGNAEMICLNNTLVHINLGYVEIVFSLWKRVRIIRRQKLKAAGKGLP